MSTQHLIGITLIALFFAAMIASVLTVLSSKEESAKMTGVRFFVWWFLLECLLVGLWLVKH